MSKLMNRILRKLAVKMGTLIYQVRAAVAQETLPKFANTPKNSRIDLPRRIINPERIFLGNNVSFGPGTFLYAMTHYPTVSMQHPDKTLPVQRFDSEIIIGNNVTATADLQIAAQSQITIEDDVMFASNIHINDGLHGYENANEPYKYQNIIKMAPIVIKKGSWIGQNVVILPNVTIGEFVIIGANSVVNRNIPDRSIAVGSPAKVIKEWSQAELRWISMTNYKELRE